LSQTYIVEHAREKLQACVEKGLEFLDESAKVSVLWHLENDFKITKDSIMEKPSDFVSALHQIFGEGALILEKRISGEICKDFAISSEGSQSFSDTVELAKKKVRSWEQETKYWKNL
jgi:hypothetical protein